MPLMFANPEDRFSRVEALMVSNLDFNVFVSDEKSSFLG